MKHSSKSKMSHYLSDDYYLVPKHLANFPDTAKRMQICYYIIGRLFEILDDRKHMSEDIFTLIEQDITEWIDMLNDYLVAIHLNPVEVKKFNAMKEYYHTIRMDCIEYLIYQIDESYYDINVRLQKIFDMISATICSLESTPHSQEHLRDFYTQMNDIKDILESEKYKEQITILQYKSRSKKYVAASMYVKKLRLYP